MNMAHMNEYGTHELVIIHDLFFKNWQVKTAVGHSVQSTVFDHVSQRNKQRERERERARKKEKDMYTHVCVCV